MPHSKSTFKISTSQTQRPEAPQTQAGAGGGPPVHVPIGTRPVTRRQVHRDFRLWGSCSPGSGAPCTRPVAASPRTQIGTAGSRLFPAQSTRVKGRPETEQSESTVPSLGASTWFEAAFRGKEGGDLLCFPPNGVPEDTSPRTAESLRRGRSGRAALPLLTTRVTRTPARAQGHSPQQPRSPWCLHPEMPRKAALAGGSRGGGDSEKERTRPPPWPWDAEVGSEGRLACSRGWVSLTRMWSGWERGREPFAGQGRATGV